ncbi:MAG: SUMF1/EgtB/PvdO family nonheme iron enzyme [Candidatus Promineifilaceae bacterium]
MAEAKPTWIGAMLSGRYRIESMLGHGGMSTVYKGLDTHLQRTVAIKMIHPHLSERPQFVRRFEQEASAVARLRHPNILQVHDYNHDKGSYYMVLEYIPGQTLDQRLDSLKAANLRLPLAEVVHLLVPICDAVAYAHEQGIYHRDLKPSNIMINLLGQAILMDFGVAKIVGGQVHTETGATIGTATYMAPEGVKGESIDHRADLYSLGVILFEMAAGKPPYEGGSPLTVMLAHVNEPVPDIRLSNSNVPDILVSILNKALAKKPADRFQSAVEMGNALRAIGQQLTGQTIPQSRLTSSQGFASDEYLDTMPVGGKPLTGTGSAPAYTEVAPRRQPTPTSTPIPPQAKPKRSNGRLLWMAGGAAVLLFLMVVAAAAVILLPRLLRKPPSSAGMVQIPGGTYSIGLNQGGPNYAPVQEISLEDFWIDRYEVTGAEYAAYLNDANGDPPATWAGGVLPTDQAKYPVQGVTYDMAFNYCKWANKRLPTEAEWEVAARGSHNLLYPWGNAENAVALPEGKSYPVGSVPANQSAFGVFDMAGNVWEWVSDPYVAVGSDQEVLRGGAHDFLKDMAYRLIGDPEVPTMYTTAGFRCAADKVELTEDDTLLVNDDFTNPESGWPVVDEGSVLSGYHPPDFYHVQSSAPNHISTAFFGGSFEDVTVSSDVFVDSTDTPNGDFRYGLIVRRIENQFYAFTVDPRQHHWDVLKGTIEGPVTLAEGEIDTLQGLTATDTLRVDASGSSLSFSINGEVVSQIPDSDYRIGDIGFYVETFDETRAHIHYDSLTVRQLPPAAAENVILQDDFDNPASGWPEVAEGSVLSGYHPPDYYHVQSSEPNHVSTAYFDQQLTDFSMEANVFVDSTNTETGDFYYGLSIRHQGDQFYAFMISPRAHHWKVVKNTSTGPVVLAEGDINTLTAEHDIDVLRVDAAGPELLFHINGRAVTHLEDGDYASGEIGFIVETLDETRAHIHYDSLLVTQVEMDVAAAPTAVVVEPTPGETAVPTEVPATTIPQATPTPAGPLPSSEGMVMVPSRSYPIGKVGDRVELNEYWIDRFEVTNAQFAEYIQEVGIEPPSYWAEANIPTEMGNHPVESITWQEAADYCTWLDKRLPSEAEWEAAARGPEGWLYPWGNVRSAVPLPTSDTYPVGSIAENRSFFGVFDMAGNVWEWVDQPYQEIPAGQRVLRGGANNFQNDLVFRAVGDPESTNMFADAGIRCAASQVDVVPDPLVLMQDDFADLDSGWFQARSPVGPYFYGYHPTDFYHVQVSDANDCLTVYEQDNFDNFMAEIDIFIAATNTEVGRFRYGLLIRDNGSEFYAFTISPRDQTWQVMKETAEGIQMMDSGTGTSIQGGTQANRDRLFVIANGPEMSFFLNGGLVSRITDTTLTSGHVGFIVQTQDETYAHTHYDDITLWQLPPNLAPAQTDQPNQDYPMDSPVCRGSVSEDNLLVNFVSYTIVPGDTLSGISAQFGVSIEDILGANGRTIESPSFIRAGASIIIPIQF